jgi:hypothetical protein
MPPVDYSALPASARATTPAPLGTMGPMSAVQSPSTQTRPCWQSKARKHAWLGRPADPCPEHAAELPRAAPKSAMHATHRRLCTEALPPRAACLRRRARRGRGHPDKRSVQGQQNLALLHRLSGHHCDAPHATRSRRFYGHFHLHGLQHHQDLLLLHGVADIDPNLPHRARYVGHHICRHVTDTNTRCERFGLVFVGRSGGVEEGQGYRGGPFAARVYGRRFPGSRALALGN